MAVLDAPPAPTLDPEWLGLSDGGSGDGWGDDGGEGGGGWWGEEPDEWESDGSSRYQMSRARRVVSLVTVGIVGLASIGGFVLLLIGSSAEAAVPARVISVDPARGGDHSKTLTVNFTMRNTTAQPSGAECMVDVFDGGTDIGSARVVDQGVIEPSATVSGQALVSLGHRPMPADPAATVTCQAVALAVSK
jgi:hypothetical protein